MISLEGVSLMLEGVSVFRDLNLKIGRKERLVVQGESGSGKTTLLRLIAGFVAPDAGVVKLAGRTASKEGKILLPPHRRGLNMVFQDLALWPHMNVEENIAFGLKMQGVAKRERTERVTQILEMIDLPGYQKRQVNTLSGGQRQRVALARALVTQPGVLLMDEPLAGLDPGLAQKLCDDIVRLHNILGFTLVYVTHSQKEVKRIATRHFYLKKI